MTIGLTFMIPLTMGLCSLLIWQISLVWHNMTSLEDMYNEIAERQARKDNKKHYFGYDLGIGQNLETFFGSSIWMWLLPTQPPAGTGTHFKLNPNLTVHDA
eukprot:TRINITY_DN259_c0_g4_i3.p1 TRINITY_DN259_c0_g4~~TRINITY_DN259_c0_g4_i3.p1  ORF type:complete len:101 (-),score=20.63 TRINITY_DN259_c0_g4_i3:117-419(-)